MAERPYQFVGPLMKAMHDLRNTLNTDVMFIPREGYNVLLMQLSLLAMTLKIIQDLHPDLVTDQALLDRLLTSVDTGPNGDKSGWPGWLVLGVPPENLAQYGATEADSPFALQEKINIYNAANQ